MKFQTIISVNQLTENLDTPNWLILDCRGGVLYEKRKYENYLKGHIPNAYYYCFSEHSMRDSGIEATTSCCGSIGTDKIIDNLKDYGFDETSQIILYDVSSSSFTDSMWLMLRSIGCKNVAVLQGGLASWEAQKMPMNYDEKSQKLAEPLVRENTIREYKPQKQNDVIAQIYQDL